MGNINGNGERQGLSEARRPPREIFNDASKAIADLQDLLRTGPQDWLYDELLRSVDQGPVKIYWELVHKILLSDVTEKSIGLLESSILAIKKDAGIASESEPLRRGLSSVFVRRQAEQDKEVDEKIIFLLKLVDKIIETLKLIFEFQKRVGKNSRLAERNKLLSEQFASVILEFSQVEQGLENVLLLVQLEEAQGRQYSVLSLINPLFSNTIPPSSLRELLLNARSYPELLKIIEEAILADALFVAGIQLFSGLQDTEIVGTYEDFMARTYQNRAIRAETALVPTRGPTQQPTLSLNDLSALARLLSVNPGDQEVRAAVQRLGGEMESVAMVDHDGGTGRTNLRMQIQDNSASQANQAITSSAIEVEPLPGKDELRNNYLSEVKGLFVLLISHVRLLQVMTLVSETTFTELPQSSLHLFKEQNRLIAESIIKINSEYGNVFDHVNFGLIVRLAGLIGHFAELSNQPFESMLSQWINMLPVNIKVN